MGSTGPRLHDLWHPRSFFSDLFEGPDLPFSPPSTHKGSTPLPHLTDSVGSPVSTTVTSKGSPHGVREVVEVIGVLGGRGREAPGREGHVTDGLSEVGRVGGLRRGSRRTGCRDTGPRVGRRGPERPDGTGYRGPP